MRHGHGTEQSAQSRTVKTKAVPPIPIANGGHGTNLTWRRDELRSDPINEQAKGCDEDERCKGGNHKMRPGCNERSSRAPERRSRLLISIQRWRGQGVLSEVRALALLLFLRRLAGDVSGFVAIRLLKPLFVPRLESAGEVQTSKLGEKRHHFAGRG
jgi:hypothetical protein